MPDFTMCQSRMCRHADTCRRHADSGTKPNEWRQSYFVIDREVDLLDGCDSYWPTTPKPVWDEGDPWEIEPGESGDGRIIRKAIDDE